jgi:hypothetical protein
MGLSRRWSFSGTSALAVFATTWITSGCRSSDCNDTATCAIAGDDVVIAANDTPGEASDDVVVANDAAVEANDDVVGFRDAFVGLLDDPQNANDGGFETSNVVADANGDAADDRPLMEAGIADAGGGRDAASEAATDAPNKCASNVLTPVTAVASSMTTHLASEAIDSNFTTRWESIWGVDPQWIYVDFGAKVFVNRIQIAWLHACAANYDLQVSNDATTWVTMRSIVGNTTGGSSPPTDWTTAVDHQGLVGVGRYVRVNGTARCSSTYGYSMWEMQVSGDRNASCTP